MTNGEESTVEQGATMENLHQDFLDDEPLGAWWSYRLLRTEYEGEAAYAVHEVHYVPAEGADHAHGLGFTEHPVPFIGDSPEEVRLDLLRAAADCDNAVIDYAEVRETDERVPMSLAETIAAIIREVDGDHTMGAGALAEAIVEHLTRG